MIAGAWLPLSIVPFVSYTSSIEPGTGGYARTTVPVIESAAVTILVVIACATLLLRRRLPLIPFAMAVLVQLSFLVVPTTAGTPLLLITAYSMAVYRSNRACWAGFGIAVGVVAIVAAASASWGGVAVSTASNAVILTIVFGLIGSLVGVNVGNRKRYIEAVIDRSRQLLVERDQQAQLAAAAERTRIAREMHDIVSHSLTVVVALAEGAAATDDPVRAREAMDAASATARTALAEMRATLGVLRTDDPGAPLVPAEPVSPQSTVAAAQRAGFPATLTVTGDDTSPPVVRYATGRIVQEGVTNAMRHARLATQIRVRIDRSPTRVRIEIMNDGAHGSASEGGFGIRGLVERAAHVGGTLHSGPAGGGRWLLHADLPFVAPPVPQDASPVPQDAAEASA
nr:histidine kinase [Microbacterium ulmi]